MSTFINKTNAITVIETELSKVSVEFNKQNPFFGIEKTVVSKNDTDDEDNSGTEGVKLFGDYTVLVNFVTLMIRLCNLEDLKLYIDIFNDIGVPRLGT